VNRVFGRHLEAARTLLRWGAIAGVAVGAIVAWAGPGSGTHYPWIGSRASDLVPVASPVSVEAITRTIADHCGLHSTIDPRLKDEVVLITDGQMRVGALAELVETAAGTEFRFVQGTLHAGLGANKATLIRRLTEADGELARVGRTTLGADATGLRTVVDVPFASEDFLAMRRFRASDLSETQRRFVEAHASRPVDLSSDVFVQLRPWLFFTVRLAASEVLTLQDPGPKGETVERQWPVGAHTLSLGVR